MVASQAWVTEADQKSLSYVILMVNSHALSGRRVATLALVVRTYICGNAPRIASRPVSPAAPYHMLERGLLLRNSIHFSHLDQYYAQ